MLNFKKTKGEKMDIKQEFIEIYTQNIKREGSEKLLEWLQNTDFFTAPASTRFHSCVEGGLVLHSVLVYKRFIKKLEWEFGKDWEQVFSKESAAICGLLHDLCKVDFYKSELRNVKVDGQWTQKPYYTVSDNLPYGHGEKTVYIISGFMRLTRDEAMAINWHMGGFDTRVKGGSYAMGDAFRKHPLAMLFHTADLETCYLDEE